MGPLAISEAAIAATELGPLVIPAEAKRRAGTLAPSNLILPEAALAAIRETGQDQRHNHPVSRMIAARWKTPII